MNLSNRHVSDVYALACFVTGGGLMALFDAIGLFIPTHQAQVNAIGGALIAIAGIIRVGFNPTPSNAPSVPAPGASVKI